MKRWRRKNANSQHSSSQISLERKDLYEGGQKELDKKRTGIWYKTGKFIKSWDEVAQTVRETLHVDGDEDQKTHVGGFFTFLAKMYLLYVVYVSGYKMLTRKNSYILTQEANVPSDYVQNTPVKNLNQLHYAILDHNDKYYLLEETKRYIDISVIHVTYYYVNGAEKKKKFTYNVKDCQQSDFTQSKEQIKYFQADVKKKGHNFICLSDEALNLTIEGNIQSRKIHNVRNTYLSVQVDWCKNTTLNPTKCAPLEEIKTWLFNKQLEPLAFNNKPALKDFDRNVRPGFSQYPAVPFESGIKSDLWFRFEENQFTKKDRFYEMGKETSSFYSLKLIYSNYITVPDEFKDLQRNRIARMIYRNEETMQKHGREVIQFEQFLGDVAGIYDLLMFFIVSLLGGYIDFNARVKWVKKFYRFTDCNSGAQMKKEDRLANDTGRINLGNMNLPWHYIKHESIFGYIIRCICCENEVEKLQNLVIETGSQQVEDDFNFIHYIKRMRLSNWETEKWELNNEINYNDFPKHHPILVHEITVEQLQDEIEKTMEDRVKQYLLGAALDTEPKERIRSATQLAHRLSNRRVKTSLKQSQTPWQVSPVKKESSDFDTDRPFFNDYEPEWVRKSLAVNDIELQVRDQQSDVDFQVKKEYKPNEYRR